jgi:tRNA-specific 2-thiouridylase
MNIVIGMSGGVDSSVSALLLKEQGHTVTGVFMKNWEEDDTDTYCAAAEDAADAKAVCDKIGIELHTVNFAQEYWDNVFDYFLQEYRAGRTPNPDVLCNQEIKFKAFLDHAKHMGADKIAMGHYARVSEHAPYQLLKGLDANKDQSYFLYRLQEHQLAQSLFPVGELPKPQVRKLAEDAGLVTYNKKDSTGICFIGERKFKDFLETYLPAQPGDIRTQSGDKIGTHHGMMYYTLGQRQGLNIGGLKNYSDAPWFVADKDIAGNTLMVVQGTDHPALFKSTLTASQLTFVNDAPVQGKRYTAKVRYRQTDTPCCVDFIDDNTMTLTFDEPQRAVTPGQSVVLYDADVCLGGGVIV